MSENQIEELELAIAGALENPEDEGAWDEVESLAGSLDEPDRVAKAYREVLARDLSKDTAVEIGQRAVRFHEEWFGDDPAGLADVLERVLALNPKSEWAFQQLTVVLTVSERWNDVLSLYDRNLKSTRGKARRLKLLDEAYQVAKDLADMPERAIDYLKAKLAIESDEKQEQALERLLEKHERYGDLIELWREQSHKQADAERHATLLRIGNCWFENLSDPGQALDTVRELLDELSQANDGDACGLLERVATAENTSPSIREEALLLVRHRYESTSRHSEIVRVLEAVLPLGDDETRRALHSELGQRLSDLEEHTAALDHYSALLLMDPASAATQRALRRQAELTDRMDRYASALAAAAEACADTSRKVSLLLDAGRTVLEHCSDEPGAIDLLRGALDLSGISPQDALTVGRRLNELLERAERHSERLGVLERLADAESVDSSRRALIGDIAVLAEALGEVDRSLTAWRRRLEADSGDQRAHDAIIAILTRETRWSELIDALRARLGSGVPDSQRRADLERIANTYEAELEDQSNALETWQQIGQEFGEDPQVIESLSRLMRALGSWSDLATLLEGANARQVDYLADQLARLGDAYQESIGDSAKAIQCYRRALTVDPRRPSARVGLAGLLENADSRNAAAEALVHSYRTTGDLMGLLDLTDARIAGTDDVRRHIEILSEAVDIAENVAHDGERACLMVCRLFPLTPKDGVLEDRMVRLGRETGKLDAVIDAYRAAMASFAGAEIYFVSEMLFRLADLLEREIEDSDAALTAYLAVLEAQPGKLEALGAAVRLAARSARWSDVAASVENYIVDQGHLPEGPLSDAQSIAEDNSEIGMLCSALTEALEQGRVLARHGAELHWRIAQWQRDKRNDLEGAEAALRSSTSLDRNRIDTHQALADVQRQQIQLRPGLHATLLRLIELLPDNLDLVTEDAELADTELSPEVAVERIVALYDRASSAWRGSAPAQSSRDAAELVDWAVARLVERYSQSDQGSRALDLLVEASRLPYPGDRKRELRNRAAHIAAEVLGDKDAAVEMYRSVLAQSPQDLSALGSLAGLYREKNRLSELLAVRRHELALGPDAERAGELRLEISALIDEIEVSVDRLQLLRDNLAASPGHRASVDAVIRHLERLAKYDVLADLLAEQAEAVEQIPDPERSAELWATVAELSEKRLSDTERAIFCHRKVANLAPTLHALDSLARLFIDRNQPAAAVPWLSQAIRQIDDSGRPTLVLRLAKAHIASGHPDEAAGVLRNELDIVEQPVLDLRELLAQLHREAGRWQELADVLTAALPHMDDEKRIADWAREAANIYHDEIGMPAEAVPALGKALELVPKDRNLRTMMAKSLRVADRLEDSRDILEALISEFGRRRSKERAGIHVELAQVARGEAKLDEAMSELELASKMDSGNAHILLSLAELASDQGDFDQAEKSLRQLLLVVRRQKNDGNIEAVGISEVLFELHRIAAIRDDEDKAEELLESVLEASSSSDVEALRLMRALVEHDEHELLLRSLRARLDQSTEGDHAARLYRHVAEVLERNLDQPGEALDALLKAIHIDPDNRDLHDWGRVLAGQLSRLDDYIGCLEGAVKSLRRQDESHRAATLLMRAGQVSETDLDDLEKARSFYSQAEPLAPNPADALGALSRVCGLLGDDEEQARALDELATLAIAEGPTAAQADALYRLAELQATQAGLVDRCLEILGNALEVEPRYHQAAEIFRKLADTSSDAPQVLDGYEQVARSGSDRETLMDYLVRRAYSEGATPVQVREAIEIAREFEEHDRASALLEQAVDAARSSDEGLAGAVWAITALVAVRASQRRFEEAKNLLAESSHMIDAEELMRLGLEIAGSAAEAGENNIALDSYEVLRQQDPRRREVWEPYFNLLRSTGDSASLIAMVNATIPSLLEAEDRNVMRLAKASVLIAEDREDETIETLRDALLDDPNNIEATGMLEEVLRKSGNQDALADFLWQRFEEAREHGNADTITDIAFRLGGLLDQMGSQETVGVFRQALEFAPESPRLLSAVLSHLTEDATPENRASLTERLLRVSDSGAAPALTVELCNLYEQAGDGTGIQRALEIGQGLAPTDETIKQRLEAWYRESGQWEALARMMITEAQATEDEAAAVARLREAATLYRDYLSNLPAAVDVLNTACERSPSDPDLVSELASCQAAMGNYDSAAERITTSLEVIQGHPRLNLLLLRSDLLAGLGQGDQALADLEEANQLDPETAGPMLISGLERHRSMAMDRGDLDGERHATSRLIELAIARSDEDTARQLLLTWSERDPDDRETLYKLRDMDSQAEHWDGVIAATSRLCELEEEEGPQLDAARKLAEAAENAESPSLALRGLQAVFARQPHSDEVRALLRSLYEATGAVRELADLLLADAEHAGSDDDKYETLRRAADLYVNQLADPAAAIEPAQRAKEIRPDDHATVVLLADVLIASGSLNEAIEMLEPAIAGHKRRSPDLASLQYRMAKVAAATGDKDNQLGWLKKAFDVDRKDGLIASELAHLATELGDYDLALKPLRAITLMDSPGPVSRVMALLWEAKIEHARGNRAKAELWAKKALREDPGYAEAQEFLAAISE